MNKNVYRKIALVLNIIVFAYFLYLDIKYGFPSNVKAFFYAVGYLVFFLINIVALF